MRSTESGPLSNSGSLLIQRNGEARDQCPVFGTDDHELRAGAKSADCWGHDSDEAARCGDPVFVGLIVLDFKPTAGPGHGESVRARTSLGHAVRSAITHNFDGPVGFILVRLQGGDTVTKAVGHRV